MHNIFPRAILRIHYTKKKLRSAETWSTQHNAAPLNSLYNVNHSKYNLWHLVTCVSNFYSIEILSGHFYLSASPPVLIQCSDCPEWRRRYKTIVQYHWSQSVSSFVFCLTKYNKSPPPKKCCQDNIITFSPKILSHFYSLWYATGFGVGYWSHSVQT